MEKPKVTYCPPGPVSPELSFQSYAWDKTLGDCQGLPRNSGPPEQSFMDARGMKELVEQDFEEGLVLEALLDTDSATGFALLTDLMRELGRGREE